MNIKWICPHCGDEQTEEKPKTYCLNCHKGKYQEWHQCECGLPAGMDCPAEKIPAGLSRCLRKECSHPAYGLLWQTRGGHRQSVPADRISRLQIYER